jgi:hypothetical protein
VTYLTAFAGMSGRLAEMSVQCAPASRDMATAVSVCPSPRWNRQAREGLAAAE